MLSERRQRVLSALIEEYVAHAMPVGSRTLVERYKLGVSSATVRNELSVLEDAGYIKQPHTSAGRIPTDSGYRAFVDDLLSSDIAFDDKQHQTVVADLRRSATELDTLIEQTSLVLTQLTDCLSIILAPSVISLSIKKLTLVNIAEKQLLIVVITEDGQVFNRHVECIEPVDSDEIRRIENTFNKKFVGKSLADIQQDFDLKTFEFLQSPLVRVILEEVVSCLQDSRAGRAHRLGFSSLLKKPEFSHSQALLPITQILEDDTILLHILEDGSIDQNTVVKIGSENNSAELSGVSVVASQYGRSDASGVIAVIGPTRMDYSKVIKAVHAAQKALQDD